MGLFTDLASGVVMSSRNKRQFVDWMSEAYEKDLGLSKEEARQRAQHAWKSNPLLEIEIQWLAAMYRDMEMLPAKEASDRAYEQFSSPEQHEAATDMAERFKTTVEGVAGRPIDPRFVGRWDEGEKKQWGI